MPEVPGRSHGPTDGAPRGRPTGLGYELKWEIKDDWARQLITVLAGHGAVGYMRETAGTGSRRTRSAAAIEAECGFIVRATRLLARRGIWRFVAVGDDCYPLVHQTLLGFGSLYRVAYGGTIARSVPGDLTVSVTGDVRDPVLVTGSRVIRDLFGDEGRPVAILVVGVLDQLADAREARRYVSAVVDWAPVGSFLAASLALTDGTGSGANRAAGSAIKRQTLADITALFDGLTLLRPGLVEVSQWRVSGAARTQRGTVVLQRVAGVARKDPVRSGPGDAACDASQSTLAGPASQPRTKADGHGLRSRM